MNSRANGAAEAGFWPVNRLRVDDRVWLPDFAAGEVDAHLDQLVLRGPSGLGRAGRPRPRSSFVYAVTP